MSANLPDFEELEEALRVVGYSARLEILHQLRFPRAASELRVAARQRTGGRAATLMARQSLLEHLQKLVDIGVVKETGEPGATGPREYVVNAARFYQVVEDFRSVGSILASRDAASMDATYDRTAQPAPQTGPKGPRLVLVHGLLEGKSFPLDKTTIDGDTWWVGRSREASVALDYDPFVSLRNAAITRTGDGFQVRDSGQSRNGTFVDWERVTEKAAPLRPGSVVGVGRSLLVFRDD